MLHTVQPFLSQPSLPRSVPGHFGTWGVLQRQYPEADLWHWGGQLWWHLGGSTNFNLVASPRSVYLGVSINGDTGIPLNHPFYINNFNEGFLYKPSSIRPIYLVHPRQQWYATAVRGTTGKVNLKAVNHPWFAKLSTKHIIRYFFDWCMSHVFWQKVGLEKIDQVYFVEAWNLAMRLRLQMGTII